MTENKLQINADKTETMLFNSSKLKHPPEPFLICEVTISFSDLVRNFGFYRDKDLFMKEHVNFICKTAFLEIRRISAIRHYLTDDATRTLIVSLVLSRFDYCNSLGWSPPELGGQTSESPKLYSPSCSPCTSTCSLQYSDIFTGCLSEPEFPIRLHASVSVPLPHPSLLISLTFYICTLLLDLFSQVPTPAPSKFHSASARQKVIVLSSILVLLSGTYCHCTLEMLQLSAHSSLL